MDARARLFRNAPTDAEYLWWYFLRGGQLDDVKFRRQAPIGPYIVDFVTFAHKLVIELDGGQHQEQQRYDKHRTEWLNWQGFRVLRYWNHEVLAQHGGSAGGDLGRCATSEAPDYRRLRLIRLEAR